MLAGVKTCPSSLLQLLQWVFEGFAPSAYFVPEQEQEGSHCCTLCSLPPTPFCSAFLRSHEIPANFCPIELGVFVVRGGQQCPLDVEIAKLT